MKTIAVSIDESTLRIIDRIAAAGTPTARSAARRRSRGERTSRSHVVREALDRYVAEIERGEREEQDRSALARHRSRLAKQAAALVGEPRQP